MRRSKPRLLVAVAVITARMAPAADAGADPSLHVTREGAAVDCPTEEELERAATQALGATDAPRAHAYRVSFERTSTSYRAEIVDESAQRTRRLEDVQTECAPLGRAVAVALAMMWGTEREDARAAGEPSAPPAPAPAAERLAPGSSAPLPRTVPSRWVLGAGAAAALAVARAASPALLADAAFEYGRFSLALGALWIPPQRLDLAPGVVDVGLLAGTARGCAFAFRTIRVGACARLLAGALQASSRGYDTDGARSRPWLALGLEAFVDGPLLSPWIGYRAAAGALVPLHAEVFSIDNVGSAYETPPVGAIVSLAIQVATRGFVHESPP